MGTSNTVPSKWMIRQASQNPDHNVVGTDRGWELDKGVYEPPELLQAMKGVVITMPTITSITFQQKRNLSLAKGDLLVIKANFVEDVTLVSGDPTISFEENGVYQEAVYNASKSDANTLVFEYTPTVEGAIDNFVGGISGTGVLHDADGNIANQAYPATFSAPTNIKVVA